VRFRLIPRDEGFFELLSRLATKMTDSSTLLCNLFAHPDRRDHFSHAIKDVEHQADDITHEVAVRLNRSFVTPLDREDILRLASELDNVVDLIDGTARRAVMFHISDTREPARALSEILMRCAGQLAHGVNEIKHPQSVNRVSRDVKKLEEEGDAIYHTAVGGLFNGAADPIEIMKWKELYDTLERAIDQCQTVSIVLESISVKHS
jgi:predicted phosphate transport protein (TIGR00153 family)